MAAMCQAALPLSGLSLAFAESLRQLQNAGLHHHAELQQVRSSLPMKIPIGSIGPPPGLLRRDYSSRQVPDRPPAPREETNRPAGKKGSLTEDPEIVEQSLPESQTQQASSASSCELPKLREAPSQCHWCKETREEPMKLLSLSSREVSQKANTQVAYFADTSASETEPMRLLPQSGEARSWQDAVQCRSASQVCHFCEGCSSTFTSPVAFVNGVEVEQCTGEMGATTETRRGGLSKLSVKPREEELTLEEVLRTFDGVDIFLFLRYDVDEVEAKGASDRHLVMPLNDQWLRTSEAGTESDSLVERLDFDALAAMYLEYLRREGLIPADPDGVDVRRVFHHAQMGDVGRGPISDFLKQAQEQHWTEAAKGESKAPPDGVPMTSRYKMMVYLDLIAEQDVRRYHCQCSKCHPCHPCPDVTAEEQVETKEQEKLKHDICPYGRKCHGMKCSYHHSPRGNTHAASKNHDYGGELTLVKGLKFHSWMKGYLRHSKEEAKAKARAAARKRERATGAKGVKE
eukprot:CAMPEP_0178390404 /NCGR_PEP_ID=MMETSP0689_2-20121128/10630_1 /TAXON_ID=160604 /ORGANISM="Amphidinium massartii, Strain CS-259" /LENGTH=515 /DNA_ID=CAMNT_0020010915 /DNA_START=95 /DNA_END=1642 /DNA_ORIENTATION=-